MMGLEAIKDASLEYKTKGTSFLYLSRSTELLDMVSLAEKKKKELLDMVSLAGFHEHICVEAKGPVIVSRTIYIYFFKTGSLTDPSFTHQVMLAGQRALEVFLCLTLPFKLGFQVCASLLNF